MNLAPVLLDTNVASFMLTARPEAALYRADMRGGRPMISFQTEAELLAGADMRGRGAKRRRSLSTFLSDDVLVVYPDRQTDRTWAHLRAAMSKQGLTLETADLWGGRLR